METAEQYIAMAHFACTCGALGRTSEGRAEARSRLEQARQRKPEGHDEIDRKPADATQAAMDLTVYEVFDLWAHCTCPGRPR